MVVFVSHAHQQRRRRTLAQPLVLVARATTIGVSSPILRGIGVIVVIRGGGGGGFHDDDSSFDASTCPLNATTKHTTTTPLAKRVFED